MLPLAVPAYVLVFVLLGQYDEASALQRAVRSLLRRPACPTCAPRRARSSCSRSSCTRTSTCSGAARSWASRASRSRPRGRSGSPYGAALRRVALPLARPALGAGVALAVMEALADFGAVNLLGYRALTDAIYRVWYGTFDQAAALQLATVLVSAGAHARRARAAAARPRPLPPGARPRRRRHPARLHGPAALGGRGRRRPRCWRSSSCSRCCSCSCGPRSRSPTARRARPLARAAVNSLLLAAIAAVLAVIAATVVAYGARAHPSRADRARRARERARLRHPRHGRRGRGLRPAGLDRPPAARAPAHRHGGRPGRSPTSSASTRLRCSRSSRA